MRATGFRLSNMKKRTKPYLQSILTFDVGIQKFRSTANYRFLQSKESTVAHFQKVAANKHGRKLVKVSMCLIGNEEPPKWYLEANGKLWSDDLVAPKTPDLVEALQNCLAYMEKDSDDAQERADFATALAAINKAQISQNPQENWENDYIQFPRLIAEMEAVGGFVPKLKELSEAMDLTHQEIAIITTRAQAKWDEIKTLTVKEEL